MRWATAMIRVSSSTRACRSRSRRRPRRSAGAGRPASSTLPVTFSDATSVSSTTSRRICSTSRWFSASIDLRFSSSRRSRSALRLLDRRAGAGPRRRGGPRLRISSACDLRLGDEPRFSSRSCRASSRALSASSSASRMRSRRASIIPWIRPNASFLSTKKTIRNVMTVQIMRPGTTVIRSLPESSSVSPARGRCVASSASLHRLRQDVREQAAEQAVEHDRLDEGEPEPLDARAARCAARAGARPPGSSSRTCSRGRCRRPRRRGRRRAPKAIARPALTTSSPSTCARSIAKTDPIHPPSRFLNVPVRSLRRCRWRRAARRRTPGS